jgi:hypothetical protein
MKASQASVEEKNIQLFKIYNSKYFINSIYELNHCLLLLLRVCEIKCILLYF